MLKGYCLPVVFLLISLGVAAQSRTYPRFMIDSATRQRMRSSVFNAAMADTSILPGNIQVTGQPAMGDKMQVVITPYAYTTKESLPEAYIMIRTARDSSIKGIPSLRSGQAITLENADFPVQIVARRWKSKPIPVTLTSPKNYRISLYFERVKNDKHIAYIGNDALGSLPSF
jgi:hypothetical protein